MKTLTHTIVGTVLGVLVAALSGGEILAQGLGKEFGGFGAPASSRAEVIIEGTPERTRVRPGDQFAIGVVLDHDRGWHTWPSADQDVLPESIAQFAIRTSVTLGDADWLSAGPIQWPEPHEVTNPLGEPPTVKSYEGRAVAYVPVAVSPEAEPGVRTLTLTIDYQACDATICLMPESKEIEIDLEVVGADVAIEATPDPDRVALFEGFDRAVFAGMATSQASSVDGGEPVIVAEDGANQEAGAPSDDGSAAGTTEFFGLSLSFEGPVGMTLLILLSAIGGAILNLTPCVLPVIPIKVMTLTSHANKPGRALYLGLWMAIGVVAFWVGIGLPAAFVGGIVGDPSRVFGIWWVTLGLGVLIGLMALGLMGLFTLTLPQKVYAVNPNADNASGSFLFGVMTGVLGLPCFGFVAAALLGAAAAFPPIVTLAVFAGIGVGMAAPYLLLAAFPSLLKWVPRTGPASELVKQVMGFLLLAAAVYFIGSGLIGLVSEKPYLGRQLHWWGVAIFAGMGGVWLIIRTFVITPKVGRRLVFSLLGVAIGGAALLYAMSTTATARASYEERMRLLAEAGGVDEIVTTVWTDFTPERLARAREQGYVVVVDFTAEWCLNCKALKARVLNREPVKPALLGDSIVMMTADLTSSKAPGWDFLRDELGQTGIPLLAVYGPHLEEPWLSNAYTSSQVMAALERAGGEAVASRDGASP